MDSRGRLGTALLQLRELEASVGCAELLASIHRAGDSDAVQVGTWAADGSGHLGHGAV